MPRLERTRLVTTFAFGVSGASAGLLVQLAVSTRGARPLVPPLSLAFTLLVIAGVLLGLGVALRRAVTRRSKRAVNAFHAVRLLAAARAGQFAGALLGGFGGGLALQLLTRAVPPPTSTWLPMVLVFASGLVLVLCALVAELLCRVPPSDPEDEDAEPPGLADPEPGGA